MYIIKYIFPWVRKVPVALSPVQCKLSKMNTKREKQKRETNGTEEIFGEIAANNTP